MLLVCIYIYIYIYIFPSTVVDCRDLTAPANGRVDHPDGTTFGETATYSCNTGYNLVGNSTRMCEAAGVWSGSEPACERTYVVIMLVWSP